MCLSSKKNLIFFTVESSILCWCFSLQETFVSFFSFLFLNVTSVSIMRTVVVENITL